MIHSMAEAEFGTWQPQDHALKIEYSLPVMEEIRAGAVDGLRALPRAGVEIGGVLYGRHQAGRIRITACRALACEHAHGPAFLLSERDHAGLRELLARPGPDGAAPVGWYHSHTRSDVALTDTDIDLYNRYFPEPWQIALVVRPQLSGPSQAGFFFREPDGSLRAASSHQEFPLVPYDAPVAPPPRPAAAPAPAPAAAPPRETIRTVEPPREPAPPRREPAPPPRLQPRELAPLRKPEPRRRPPRWPWVALLFLLMLGAAAGLYAYRMGLLPRIHLPAAVSAALPAAVSAARPAPTLNLRAIDTNGQVLISWNRSAPVVLQGNHALLEIADGPHKSNIPIDREHLANGTVTYARQSARVDVRLRIYPDKGAPIEEMTSFLGQPVVAVPVPLPPPSAQPAAAPSPDAQLVAERDDALAEVRRLRGALAAQTARTREAEAAIRSLRRRLDVLESLRRRR